LLPGALVFWTKTGNHNRVVAMIALKPSKRFVFIVILLILLCPGLSLCAQNQSSAGAKKNKAKAETCDGAADIVPAKPMSFVRKRRPAPKQQQQSAESKTR